MHNKSAQKKPAKHKRHHLAKLQNDVQLLSLQPKIWRQRRDILTSEKGAQLLEVFTPLIIKNLSRQGAVPPPSGFC